MYTDEVLKHFHDPANAGEIENADAVAEVGNMKCGDVMRISIKVKENRIEDIKFKTYGCAAAIAASDMVCDFVKGKTLEEAENVTHKQVADALGGLPAIKMHCSSLAIAALKKAIQEYRKKT
ncbi:iron-sulfur cluster assembly scaffold protein [Candidatus Woesearchaeota archaeon]|nr:iron-sulfur cluster assembly scaffold protein [Candidatus Woesearchaeota archaeon]